MSDGKVAKLGLKRGDRVLDVGFRAIDALKAFQDEVGPNGDVTGIDLDSEVVSTAREAIREHAWSGLHVVKGSVLNLPFDEGAFDVVLCRGVLHEVRSLDRAMDEITRVLMKDGRLTIVDFTRFSRLQFERYCLGHRLRRKPCLDVHPGFARTSLSGLLTRHRLRETHYEVLDAIWTMGFIQCSPFLQRAERAVLS